MAEASVVHLIGIGGSGLSAIARVLLERGVAVSGSDRQDSALLQGLREAGARVYLGHQAENVQNADLVIRSSAVSEDNPEVQAARQRGIPVLKRSDYLEQLTSGYQTIAVAGTHGKTTTTAMTAWMLAELDQGPSFIVGSTIHNLETNARAGRGSAFVIEADEYDGMFLGLSPWAAVVTNLEHDHPDCYPSLADYREAFLAFTRRIEPDGFLLVCADDPGARWLAAQNQASRVLDYSAGGEAGYTAENWQVNETGGLTFQLLKAGAAPVPVSLQVPGVHNVRNALAALAVADQLGLPLAQAAAALSTFQGTGRRFEVIGEAGGVTVISDYAHHPAEIKATLAAARSRYPGRRVWAVWQPHTFSRTRQLLAEFGQAFADADQVIVTDIYAAREAPPVDGFSGQQAAGAISAGRVEFIPQLAAVSKQLLERLEPGDVLVVLSAGDADQICTRVSAELSTRSYNDAG
jgi:UDP-N-acetylmuramate--alanine ligase